MTHIVLWGLFHLSDLLIVDHIKLFSLQDLVQFHVNHFMIMHRD